MRMIWTVGWLCLTGAVGAADSPIPERIEFNRDVRPILSDNCFRCHGPDKNHREAELRLDVAEGYLGTPDHKGVVVPRDPAKSPLFARITSKDPDELMPPRDSGKSLSARDITILKKWIEQGATYQGHWAFIPPQRPELPAVKNSAAAQTAIDRFIVARLEAAGLSPNGEADRVTLCRRLYFDLTGLPPKPEEVDAFVHDTRPDAYERLVDRLLDSPQYGERMAVYWLDLVRFADTAGYHSDNPRDITPYRDYVIRAFQENLPFDQFTVEQLAGDLLPNPQLSQQVASGYNRLLQTTEEGGAQPKEYRAKYSADRVRNVASVWLGATMMCSECHDHKFDPYSIRDFYSLAAFFADVQEADVGRREPGLIVPDADQSRQLAEYDAKIAAAQQKRQALAEQLLAGTTDWSAELDPNAGWEVLTPTELRTEGESHLHRQEDGSYKVDGKVGAKESYVLTFDTPLKNVTGFRLEALADESLPAKGPGTAPNGNFVLTEFKVLIPKEKGKPDAVKLTRAIADHDQSGHAVAMAIDGKNDTGWAVLPKVGESHLAIFDVEKPILAAGGQVIVRLEFQSQHPQHNIGRWRLSATTAASPTQRWVPNDVRAALSVAAAERTADQTKRIVEFLRDQSPRLQAERDAVQAIHAEKAKFTATIPRSLVTTALKDPRTVRVLPRGNWMDDSGEVMQPAIPEFLGRVTADGRRANRLDLAQWIVSKDNPLTARVMVNRLWKLFYGTGLSKTVEDLGSQGEWPTHPELLDWLAVEFRDHAQGWDVKHLVRLMVTSRTYRQSSKQTPEARAADPFNRLLSAQNRFRLDAEFVRDNALAIAGLLSPRIGGESVHPYQPDGYWDYLNFPKRTWVADKGERLYRRGMYVWWQRSFLHPEMLIFDAPSREECVADRPRSNTPQQALALLNDPAFVEAARVFAQRILTDGGHTTEARLTWAYRRAVSRTPSAEEAAVLTKLLEKHRAEYAADPAAAETLLKSSGESPIPEGIDRVELAAWTSLARTLLNLHETVTRL